MSKRSLLNTAMGKVEAIKGFIPVPNENLLNFVGFASDSRKEDADLQMQAMKYETEESIALMKYCNERIKEKQEELKNDNLSQDERKEIHADIKAYNKMVIDKNSSAEARYRNAPEEHREYSKLLFLALVSLGGGITTAYAVSRNK